MNHRWHYFYGAQRIVRTSSRWLRQLAARMPMASATLFRQWIGKLDSILWRSSKLKSRASTTKTRQRQIPFANSLERLEQRTVLSADPFVLDAEFSIVTSNSVLPEGNSGVTSFLFAIGRTGNLDVAGYVSYAVMGVSVEADDFGGTFPSGIVNFNPGETRKFLAINVSGDSIVEDEESFDVVLTGCDSGSHIGPYYTESGSIINDDSDITDELFRPSKNYNSGRFSVDVATGDFNSDGMSDVVLGNQSTASVSVLLSNGDGTLQSSAEFAAGPNPEFVSVGDLNRDGRNDLVVSNYTETTLSVLLGNGDGTFQNPVAYTCGFGLPLYPSSVEIVDVNGDHYVDLICPNNADQSIGVLLGRGDGTFGTVILHDIGFDPRSITTGDFNEDGSIDIAVADTLHSTFSILLGNGNGLFQDPIVYTAFKLNPSNVIASGDFNRDGHADLAVSGSYINSTVSIFLSDGNGNFTEASSYFLDNLTRSIVVADYNGDGVQDFAVGYNGTVKVFLGLGDGTFGEPAEAGFDGGTYAMSAGDFNGDGRIDIATVNGSPTILLNQSGGGNKSNLKIVATNAVLAEGNSGLTPFTFTVTRSGNTSGTASVNYLVSGGGFRRGANASDFGGAFPSGVVTFNAGETTKIVTIGVSGDTASEFLESFTVTLLNPGPDVVLDIPTAIGLIVDDDGGLVRPSLLSIAATNATQSEGGSGNTEFTFTVTRTGDTSDDVSVDFAVNGTGVHPAGPADFNGELPTGLVNFLAGETTKVVSINVSGDLVIEDDEAFIVTLFNPTHNVSLGTPTAIGTILNDDGVPGSSLAIAATSAMQSEGQSGTTQFTFTVTRSGDMSGGASANFVVAGDGPNPADAADFYGVLPSGLVNFAPGETSKVITIQVSGDLMLEDDESFSVTLSNASAGASIITASAIGTILNDDAHDDGTDVSVAVGPSSISESGSGSLVYTFKRTGDSSLPLTVSFSVGGTATLKKDYSLGGADSLVGQRGSITFSAGQTTKTVSVTPRSDKTIEADETIVLTVSSSAAYSTGAQSSATSTIINDDLPKVTLKVSPKKVAEDGSRNLVYTFSRKGSTTSPLTVNVVLGGTAMINTDYTVTGATFDASAGTILFAAGQSKVTVTFNAMADIVAEPDETIILTLKSSSHYLTGISGGIIGLIEDNRSRRSSGR